MSEKNKISRREFLSYSAMAGAIGALGVTPLLSACSDDKGGKNAALRDAGSVYIPELPDKAVDGKPLKAGLIGCGGRGTGFSQCRRQRYGRGIGRCLPGPGRKCA